MTVLKDHPQYLQAILPTRPTTSPNQPDPKPHPPFPLERRYVSAVTTLANPKPKKPLTDIQTQATPSTQTSSLFLNNYEEQSNNSQKPVAS